jgi:phosphohistidine swiveling domain-containing protein
MTEYPVTLRELQDELEIHRRVGRHEPVWRLAIALTQVASAGSYVTHDQVENPTVRPYGTPKGKVLDCGHLIVQMLTFVSSLGVDCQEATNLALDALRGDEVVKVQPKVTFDEDIVVGIMANGGIVEGVAMNTTEVIPRCDNAILVAIHPTSDARHLMKYKGIVTDHGGYTCHAGIVAREFNIPCVVGTGNATRRIRTGDKIILNEMPGSVRVVKDD